MIVKDTPFRAIGPCDLSVWLDMARKVDSPIVTYDLTAMHKAAAHHSTLCLAQCVKESTLGRDASAQRNRNPLGLMREDGSTLLTFSTWEDSVMEWVHRIEDVSYKQGVYGPETCTIEKFLVTYVGGPTCWTSHGDRCANGETWDGGIGGSVGLYVTQSLQRLNDYQGDTMSNPFPTPVVHELSRDYAKYGLTAGQANTVMSQKFSDRRGNKPLAIVLHVQDGTTKGSLSWWASGNAPASSTVMANKDGTLLTVLSDSAAPWTNGDVQKPSTKGQALLSRINNANPNLVTLSIEIEGQRGDAMTDAQRRAVCWKVIDWMQKYGLTINDVYRHADFNSVSRAFCPGAMYEEVIAAIGATPNAPIVDEWPGKPAWLPSELVKTLFPEANPDGVRTKAWFSYAARVGKAPRRIAFHGSGDKQLIEFSDGTFIDAQGKVVGNE